MTTIKKYIILILFVLNTILVNSQPLVLPTSSQASSLSSSLDNDGNFFTGTPSITIPITTIDGGGIKLPIYLSYNAQARKVDEISSWIGLGWSLNYGGVITRNVRGIPDDYNGIDDGNETKGFFYSDIAQRVNDFNMSASNTTKRDELDYFTENEYDTEPDVFYYSIPGFAGTFYFDENKVIKPEISNNLKFSYTQDGDGQLSGFTIIDNMGNKYYFEEIEISSLIISSDLWLFEETENVTTYNSTWYLSEIQPATGEEIIFSYESENYSYSFYTPVVFDGVVSIEGKRLSNITSENQEIDFNESSIDREDLSGTRALNNISIYWKKNDDVNVLRKKIILQQSYFTSPGGSAEEYKRLKLETITENNGSESKPPYVFEYNTTDVLPKRNSYEVDMWGYYNANGADNYKPIIHFYPNEEDRYRIYPIPGYTGEYYCLDHSNIWYCPIDPDDIFTCDDSFGGTGTPKDDYDRRSNPDVIDAFML